MPAFVAVPIAGGWMPPFWPPGVLPRPAVESRSVNSELALAKSLTAMPSLPATTMPVA